MNTMRTNNGQEGWPEFFTESNHPIEWEVLERVLKNNTQLSEVYFIVRMMEFNYILFRRNYEELREFESQFNKPMNFNELALKTNRGYEIGQYAIIEFNRLLH